MSKKAVIKTLEAFEQAHGQGKIDRLSRELEQQKAKVEALAGVQRKVKIETRKDCLLRFGLIGDRHVGSLYHHEGALYGFYEFCRSEGINTIYDAGDVLDGHKVYRGQEFELRDVGLAAQIKRLKVATGDGFGIRTRFIVGNHDQSFKTAAGAPVGQMIEDAVAGHEFMGEEQATVRFQTPNGEFSLMLIHPGGGSSYALSYRPQKIIESLEGGTKPDLLAIGHYHKAEMLPSYRNVCGIQTGTFQRQTPFMARGGLAANVGGWIVEVTVGDGHNVIKPLWVSFFV
jgi:hypothetical protein